MLCPSAVAIWLSPSDSCSLPFPPFSFCPLGLIPLWLLPFGWHPYEGLFNLTCPFQCSFCSSCDDFLAGSVTRRLRPRPSSAFLLSYSHKAQVMYATQFLCCRCFICSDQVLLSPNSWCPVMQTYFLLIGTLSQVRHLKLRGLGCCFTEQSTFRTCSNNHE